jgi:hypothetical protein
VAQGRTFSSSSSRHGPAIMLLPMHSPSKQLQQQLRLVLRAVRPSHPASSGRRAAHQAGTLLGCCTLPGRRRLLGRRAAAPALLAPALRVLLLLILAALLVVLVARLHIL